MLVVDRAHSEPERDRPEPVLARVVALAVAAMLALVVLAGCGDSGDDDGEAGDSASAASSEVGAEENEGAEDAAGSSAVDGSAGADTADSDSSADDGDGFGLGGEDPVDGANGVGGLTELPADTCSAYRTFFDDEVVRTRLVIRSDELKEAAQLRRQSAIDQLRRDFGEQNHLFAADAVRDLERYPFDIDPGENFDVEILAAALETLRDLVDPACNVSATDTRLRANREGPLCGNFRTLVGIENERVRLLNMTPGVIAAADRVRGDALISVAASIDGLDRDDLEEPLRELAEHPLAAPLSFDTFIDEADDDDADDEGDSDNNDGDTDDVDEDPPTPEEVAEEMRVPVQRLREVLAADCL